jgi:hypothetical protein
MADSYTHLYIAVRRIRQAASNIDMLIRAHLPSCCQ